MSKIYSSQLELVGHTPLVEVQRVAARRSLRARLLVKLESYNPAGSVKDRTALAMIEAAERDGILRPGSTIVEATSGNTGVGLAFVAAVKGYAVVIVMPETMSVERRRLVAAYGARLELTPGAEGMKGALARAETLRASIDGAVTLGQFVNPANPAVQPDASPVLSGGAAAPHKIQGIGAGFVPETYDGNVVDRILRVTNEEAVAATRELAVVEGMLCGISSGAAFSAALRLAADEAYAGKTIVALLPDTGERYLSTGVFD